MSMTETQIATVVGNLNESFPSEQGGIYHEKGDFIVLRKTACGIFRQFIIKEKSNTIGLYGDYFRECRAFIEQHKDDIEGCKITIPKDKPVKGSNAVWFNVSVAGLKNDWFARRDEMIAAAKTVYLKLHEWRLLGDVKDFCAALQVEPLAGNRMTRAEEACKVSEEGLKRIPELLEPLKSWSQQFNIFDVLKISRMEIRHSNVLAWLLDPNADHGMGAGVLKSIFEITDTEMPSEEDLRSFSVYRETENIDILLVSTKCKRIVAIENKIGAKEGIRKTAKTDDVESQLTTYCDVICGMYPGYERTLVFLTPDGTPPTDERWTVVTYSDLVGEIENLFGVAYANNSSDVNKRVLISDYIQTIKRKVLMQIDPKLRELCRKLYNENRAEFNLVFDYGKLNCSEEVEAKIKEMSSQVGATICHAGDVRFTIACLDAVLPAESSIDAWWGTTPYCCWVNVDSDKSRVSCSMGVWKGVGGGSQAAMASLLEKAGGKTWQEDKKWMAVPWNNKSGSKKINTNNWKHFSDDSDEGGDTLSQAVEKAVAEIVEWAASVVAGSSNQ